MASPRRLLARLPPVASVMVLATVSAALQPAPAAAQDVEMLGRHYGTTPPDSYYRILRANPRAFQFGPVWERRVPAIRALERGLGEGGAGGLDTGAPRTTWSPSTGFSTVGGASSGESASTESSSGSMLERAAVVGEFGVPMVMGLFADTVPAPFSSVSMHSEFWAGPNSRGMTVPQFYSEISGGRLDMVGETFDWVRTGLTRSEVTAGESGLPGQVGPFIVEILEGIEARGSVDWGRFDNDGPDGIPNSPDDDGFVDVLVVVHPTYGAECDGNDRSSERIWSHRWALQYAAGSAYVTDAPSDGGGYIRIDSYTIQPAYSCDPPANPGDEREINEIGVFAHELGHGFGLPDLYGSADHEGIGNWGLMGTGSWGCDGRSAHRPCHMGAWSKTMLGWVDVVDVPPDTDAGTVVLDPVETSGTVYRMPAGSDPDEYFLLENRQRIGSDANLFAPGLLVWHVDDEVLRSRWGSNVNVDGDRMGVWLRQADGLNELANQAGERGDAGDPFPGSTGNTAFHVSSVPSSRDHAGASTGLTVTEITGSGQLVSLALTTRYRTLTFRTEGVSVSDGAITVDGATPAAMEFTVPSSPFQVHEVEAAPGYELSAGTRVAFLGWSDGGERVRQVTTGWSDSTLAASYSGTQHRLDLTMDGPVQDVDPGTFELSPSSLDRWFDEGVEVVVEARARTGFRFTDWSGDFAAEPNPTSVVMDGPGAATAHFEQAFAVAGSPSVAFEAAVAQEIILEASLGNAPIRWTVLDGALPPGMSLSSSGVIMGAALDTGTFSVTVRAVDGLGLEAVSPPLQLQVTAPVIGSGALGSDFLLGGGVLTSHQRSFLDRHGNANGFYDLGDFRAFVLANPGLPVAADVEAPDPIRIRLQMAPGAAAGPIRDGTPKREEER